MSHGWVRVVTAFFGTFGSVALALAGSTPALAVADGTPVAEGHYRYAVKLTMTNIPRPDGSHYNSGCSAALIAPQWILTAGHCFHDVNRKPVSGPVPYDTKATIGRTDDADTNGKVVDVVADYQSPTNDIAVARLASPVYGIRPLLPSNTAPTEGQVLRIAGWGALSDVNPAPATHLQTGQVKVTTVSDTIVGVVGYLPLPTTSACLYDSGAPYFFEPEHGGPRLVSVESNGPTCPHSNVETTARVDTILPWLLTTMRDNRG
jgi:secreted trypsin-like serine protease